MEGAGNSHPGSFPTMSGQHSFLSLYLQNLAKRLSNNTNENGGTEESLSTVQEIIQRNAMLSNLTNETIASNEHHFDEQKNEIPKAEIADIDVKVEITEEEENGRLESVDHSSVKPETAIKKEFYNSELGCVEFKCWECLKVFKKERYLKMHIKEVHTEAPMALCHFCSKEFKHFHLKKHIQNVHIREECSCDECGKIYTNKKHLRDHKKAVHEGLELLCHLCSKTFKSKSYLSNHVRRFHNCIDEELVCDYCSKVFKTQNKLYLHVKAVHTIENLPCHECGKIYKNSYLLRKHIKHNHTRPKIEEPQDNFLLFPKSIGQFGQSNVYLQDNVAPKSTGMMPSAPQAGLMMQFAPHTEDALMKSSEAETVQAGVEN